MRGALILISVAVACGRRDVEPARPVPAPAAAVEPAHPPAPLAQAADGAPAEPEAAPGPPLSEAAARALLAARFRAAGLRIVEDVAVQGAGYEVTLDGLDPERRVGYEYEAAAERGTDLGAGERARLDADASLRLLLLDACDERELERRAAEFLASLPPPQPAE